MDNSGTLISGNYQAPQSSKWTGRSTDSNQELQYWYQQIKLCDLSKPDQQKVNVALVGYACDEGVRRNQGRVGAALGPSALRKSLGKLPPTIMIAS